MNALDKYSSYKESRIKWLGEIPKHWEIRKLKYMTTNLNNRRIPIESSIRGNMQERNYDYYGATGIIDRVEDYIFDEPTIVIAEDGANLLYRNIKLIYLPSGKYWVNNHAHILKANKNYDKNFIAYLLENHNYTTLISGSAQPKLTKENLMNIDFFVPFNHEQTKIANFLDKKTVQIDEAIAQKEELISRLKERRQVLTNNAVTRGLDMNVTMKESGVEWLGMIPEHWEIKKIKNIFNLIIDPAPNNNDYELLSIYTNIGVKPRKELAEKGNKASRTDGYWKVRKGDFIVNKLLAWMGAIGLSEYDGVTSPAYDILRSKNTIEGIYFHELFRMKVFSEEMKKHSRGIMDMRLRLYFDKFGGIRVPFPVLSEQKQIVKFIQNSSGKINKAISLQQKQIEKLKEYKATLIDSCVTGKVRVS